MGHQFDLPTTQAESDIVDSASPPHRVMIWDLTHERRKLYKAYKDKHDAEIAVAALRVHGLDAELVTAGDAGAGST